MKLRLQTDYALRALMLLGYANRKMTVGEIADAYLISKDHLVKVIQQLSRLGFVRAYPGRGGGVALAMGADKIFVSAVIRAMEGSNGVLDCFKDSSFCPMEPGCVLRRLMMTAESAFYDALGRSTIADLYAGPKLGGIVNLNVDIKDK